MNTTEREKTLKELVLGKCWQYIHDNFHKFNESNKIKVSLALLQKSMPTEIAGQMLVTQMSTIKIDDQPLEFFLGSDRITPDARGAAETFSVD